MALNLSMSSLDSRGKMMVAGVGLVVVIALTLLAWSMMSGETLHEGWDKHNFVCQACGKHFVIDRDKLPPKYLEKTSQGQVIWMDCPYCGKKGTGSPAIQCHNPECGKWYAQYHREADGSVKQTLRCPHCGTNPIEWDRKHKGNSRSR